ncbi:hypothetical protein JG688_00013674 [Phytophthora aleatoria]|uniref:Uncharacterized protein n=1 Tax=Phytophthora aleatoria TaxID=2496075 RepID=A0A8J5ILV8_9STRA|nr:hypothetical protein JG688_00013674 [Phytophthora aleatoria]
MNVGAHWVAIFIDRTKRFARCSTLFSRTATTRMWRKVFDDGANSRFERSSTLRENRVVHAARRKLLRGVVLSSAILEMLIANATWDDCIYQLLPYL